MPTLPACPCGKAHGANPAVASYLARIIATQGETIQVTVGTCHAWHVPRIFITFHGLKASEIPALAERYGWPRVTS